MIGHFLATLSTVQEDRVLERHMAPANQSPLGSHVSGVDGTALGWYQPQGRCELLPRLLCPAQPDRPSGHYVVTSHGIIGWNACSVAGRYAALCHRFGVARINNAIRDRVLSNRVYRRLTAPRPPDAQEMRRVYNALAVSVFLSLAKRLGRRGGKYSLLRHHSPEHGKEF